jgi:hypothetical protein
MSPRIVLYTTWKEMFGESPTRERVLELIRPLDKLHTAWLLSKLNLLLMLNRFHESSDQTAKVQTWLVNMFIDDELFEHLKRKFGPEKLEDRQPFHTSQILTLLKWVLLESTDAGVRPDIDKSAAYSIGRALMMMNDLLASPESLRALRPRRPSKTKRRLALQLQLGSSFEVNNPPSIPTSIVRSETIFRDIFAAISCKLDIRGIFQSRSGLTLEDYVDHVLGLLTYYVTLDIDRLADDPGLACLRPETFFVDSEKSVVHRFWEMELASVAELEASLRSSTGLKDQHDFIVFRRKPFMEVLESNAIPLHLGFVQEKLEAGLFWRIFNSLDTSKKRDALFTDWGRLFEQYVSGIFISAVPNAGFVPFSTFADNGDEAFDGVVISEECMIAMEYKGGFLSAAAKYSENEAEFQADLDKKFGREKGAGMEQLSRKICAIFASNARDQRVLREISTAGIKFVIPVLVVQDAFASSEVTVPYLGDVFGTLKRKKSIRRDVICTFPLVLDVSEVETLRPFLASGKLSLTDCLMERVKIGTNGFLSFRDFFRGYLSERGITFVRDDETLARFTEIMNRISLRFFKKPLEQAENES